MVRKERLELSQVTPLEPKSSASTNSATFAFYIFTLLSGVNDGTRTHDNRDHNPGLYQLSYAHHFKQNFFAKRLLFLNKFYMPKLSGTPGRTRTCYPRLRRPMLYPNELRAQFIWSGWRDSNSRHPAPKAGALPDCATPRNLCPDIER
jgi:hypothetical protein